MPLARRVIALEGDHDSWTAHQARYICCDVPEINQRARYLMNFGLGGRQCIGKTIARTNIYKVMSTLLSEFDFQLGSESEREAVDRGKFVGKLPELISVGISELKKPLWVTAWIR
ncbi:hypothetical protein SUNI508_09673 [Seiridium unicorne]|uniref:Cytochrome P450 n=1 Tax=Seiridium unicorne TaxID=138068 RepID=A0ABR2UPJ1_9PEZI